MVDLVKLGQLVRARRKELKLSQGKVARAAGLSVQYFSEIERAYGKPGRSAVRPSDEHITGIATALGLSPTVLHAAMGRLESPEDTRGRIEAEYERLSEEIHDVGEQGAWLARYRELSPKGQRIVNALIAQLDDPEED